MKDARVFFCGTLIVCVMMLSVSSSVYGVGACDSNEDCNEKTAQDAYKCEYDYSTGGCPTGFCNACRNEADCSGCKCTTQSKTDCICRLP